jgi:hypothetical protein
MILLILEDSMTHQKTFALMILIIHVMAIVMVVMIMNRNHSKNRPGHTDQVVKAWKHWETWSTDHCKVIKETHSLNETVVTHACDNGITYMVSDLPLKSLDQCLAGASCNVDVRAIPAPIEDLPMP